MNIRFVSGEVSSTSQQCRQSLPSLTAWGTASTLNVPAPSLLVLTGAKPQKEKEKDTPSEKSVPVGTLRARSLRRNRNVPPSTVFAPVDLRFAFATFRSSEGGRLQKAPSTAERLHYTPHATLRATFACMNCQQSTTKGSPSETTALDHHHPKTTLTPLE